MPPYVDLQRRFLDLNVEDFQEESDLVALLDDSTLLAAHRSTGLDRSDGWSDLLRYHRVVLFGSGGIGKTEEMKQQVNRLVASGEYAFYLRLESLQSDVPESLLPPEIRSNLHEWKAATDRDAWFFLDSVDELKLRSGSLDQALAHLLNSIGDHLPRVRVVVSSRPTDWRMDNDMATLLSWLPLPKPDGDRQLSPDDAFIDVLRRDQHYDDSTDSTGADDDSLLSVKTVALLPLTERQIRLYAESSIVAFADFLAEVDRRDAWVFARRPLDLDHLVAMWSRHKHLGTRREQVREHVRNMLRDQPDRPDDHLLSDAEAERGAADLALALELTRTEAILAPEEAPSSESSDCTLHASDILDTWTDAQRKSLLRRPLFDITAYSRVGFHHRIDREYLAAARLLEMKEVGMSNRALHRLLFSRTHGVDVVLPSLREVATWLASDEQSVAAELMIREPEALVSLGDPESLPIATRQQVILALVEKYTEARWRGVFLNTDHSQIKRFADPALGPTIRDCWHAAGEEIRGFLLQLVELAPAPDCSALTEQLANDPTQPDELRGEAIRALLACDCQRAVRRLVGRILTDPRFFANVPTDLLPILFPSVIDADQLLSLLSRIADSESASWAVSRICDTIDPVSPAAVALRDGIAREIMDHHTPTPPSDPLQSEWGHLAPALATLCDRQLSRTTPVPELLRASTIASRFGQDVEGGEAAHRLTTHFKAESTKREAAFWQELTFVDDNLRPSESWDRYYHTCEPGLTRFPVQSDRRWLLRALADQSEALRRPVALHALVGLWRGDPNPVDLEPLRTAVADDPTLLTVLSKRTNPSEPSPPIQQLEERQRRAQRKRARDEDVRLANWREWHESLRAHPTRAFSPEESERTCHNLYLWLVASGKRTDQRNVWDRQALVAAFGPEIAELAAAAFRQNWRSKVPLLWSAVPPESRNTLHYQTAIGLAGVYAESELPDWTASLTTAEAEVATAYATVEINAFPSYLTDLAHTHPDVVASVLGQEAIAELNITPHEDHLPTLSHLAHASDSVKQVVAPKLLSSLVAWSSAPFESTRGRPLRHLSDSLSVARHINDHDARNSLAQACTQAFYTSPSVADPYAIAWLQALFALKSERAADLLIDRLSTNPLPSDSQVEQTFAALFGGWSPTPLRIKNLTRRARMLDQLFRLCVKSVRFEDDAVHEGGFIPGTRDDAESARGFLLSQLIDTPGPATYEALTDIADERLVRLPDRLRLQARARAAGDSETPRSTSDVRQFLARHEMAPRDTDGLFQMLVDRLSDIADFLRNDDLSPIAVVRKIETESDMHRILAREFRVRANGAYVVSIEEEVVNRKRPDIRVASTASPHKAAIEVKLGNKGRSLKDLERALRNQLVGHYLRDPNCQVGCLILTLAKPRQWRDPHTNTLLDFHQAIDYLNAIAATIQRDQHHSCRLVVWGIDLRA